MPVYISQPTLNLGILKPRGFSIDTKGGGFEGGRNGLGESITISLTGGPILTVSYRDCFVQNAYEHQYINRMAARLNGSYRFINVPIMTDYLGMFPYIQGNWRPYTGAIPHSDGSFFSDGSGYSQARVFGTVETNAALNAGVLVINVYGALRDLAVSDWFSIYHSTKGHRAYRYWDCSEPIDVVRVVDGESLAMKQYTLYLDRPLRQAVTAGQRIELARPRCVMKFPADFTLPWEAEDFWISRPTLEFTEAF